MFVLVVLFVLVCLLAAALTAAKWLFIVALLAVLIAVVAPAL